MFYASWSAYRNAVMKTSLPIIIIMIAQILLTNSLEFTKSPQIL